MAVASFTPSKSLCRSHSPSSSRSSPPSISSSIGFSDGRRGSWARNVSRDLDLDLTGRSHAPAEMLVGSTSKGVWSGIDGWRRRRGGVGAIMCSADGIGSGLEIGQQQGLAAVVIPERAKVLALVALVMCLCNADRVVMSVAVVPLASQYGWSSSFLGIVQVRFLGPRPPPSPLFLSFISSAISLRIIRFRVDSWRLCQERKSRKSARLLKATYACIIFDFDPPLLPILHGAHLTSPMIYGSKRVMAWGVVFWSIATFLTPWAASHSTAMLLAVRALFGLAEGVAIPSMSTHLFRWFPCNERASAVGIAMAGFHLGNVMSLLLSPIILSSVGINGTFAFFASLGFVWLSAWTGRIPNDPRDSPDISHSELQLIRAGKIDSKMEGSQLPPLRHLFSKLPALAVVLANVANNWGYFVLLSWMPVYFKTVWITNSVGTLAAIISTVGAGLFVQWMGSFQTFLTLTAAIYFVVAIFYNLHATSEQVFF
ncbi:hypothetical protein GW17_00022592 [Ensete ventricosum]|nr:hypothetical protein GW17_00022592 [Ensete ventricosum]